MGLEIRDEGPGDLDSIRSVNDEAFGQRGEGRLVDSLRAACPDEFLSMVAVEGGELIGHICFSPVALHPPEGETMLGMGLAPMAVRPADQSRGIGSRLVRAGLARLAARRCVFVVVLGHPEFYPRFGFVPASQFGVRCDWEVPDEAFMILWLDEDGERIGGQVKYRPEFDALG